MPENINKHWISEKLRVLNKHWVLRQRLFVKLIQEEKFHKYTVFDCTTDCF